MAQKIVAGNWKMNLDRTQAGILISEICGMMDTEEPRPVQVLLFPSYIHIGMAVQMTASEPRIRIGAQNCSSHASGAFTGEVSASMLRSTGCTHVLVGHSERRTLFFENDQVLAEKTRRVLEEEMTPVFCIGELLNERESGGHFDVIQKQLNNGLFHLGKADFSKCIIAYEPVWAIGTGVTASSDQAQEMHAAIRSMISDKYGNETAGETSILYGGSCNEQNASSLFRLPDVDGGLIGGASLKSRSFVNIIKALP
jgi:triosephosphate isomerase